MHVGELDGPGTCANTLSMHGDMLNAPEHKINWKQWPGCQNALKEVGSNLPASAARQVPDELDGLRDHADRFNMFTDAQSIGNGTQTAENVRKCQMKLRT